MTPLLTLLALSLGAEPSLAFTSIHKSASRSRSTTAVEATASAPVEKVAIIGAGIAGLSLAHALRSTNLYKQSTKPIQIDIFDSRSDLDEKSGSGVQLTGGMAALRQISPTLQQSVSEAALPFERVVSKCRPWFGSDDGEAWQILELNIQEAIREKDAADKLAAQEEEGSDGNKGGGPSFGLVTEDGEVLAYTILRGVLQRILQEGLRNDHGVEVQFDKRLCDLSYSDSNNQEEGIVCQFVDGSKTGPYDLVIGCDGIQSAVRQFVNTGKIQSGVDTSKSSAIYSGLRITFAIQENTEEDSDTSSGSPDGQFTQFFGNGAYALTSSYGAGKGKPTAKGAFLVYPDANYIGPFPRSKSEDDDIETASAVASSTSEPVPLDENPDWTQDKRVPRDHITECLEVLQSASMPGNDVADIIQNSDRFFDLGVYLHNPFSWNGWVREVPRGVSNGGGGGGLFGGGSGEKTSKFAITTGDAAHAMPPFLGQGANQALQDSCSLASKILEYNSQVEQPLDSNDPSSKPDLARLLKEYENRRWLPTTSITAKAALLGYLEIGPSIFANFRDAFFFTMGKIGVAKKVFLDAATPKM